MHGQQNKVAINHPNQYFEESVECTKDSKEKSQTTPKVAKKQKSTETSLQVSDINWDEDM